MVVDLFTPQMSYFLPSIPYVEAILMNRTIFLEENPFLRHAKDIFLVISHDISPSHSIKYRGLMLMFIPNEHLICCLNPIPLSPN